MSGFDPAAIVGVLDAHRVEYVVVGGYAATIHGATRPTLDLDACPATDRDNLTFAPAGYHDLIQHAGRYVIGGVEVRIASLADVIRSKEAAGRGKDLDALPELHRLAAAQDLSTD